MRFGLAAALALSSLACAAQPARAAQYWFGGQDPVARGERPHPADWMDLFQPGAPWQRGESRLAAFKVSAQFVLRGTDDMIRTVVDQLHQHRVAFAVEMGAVERRPDECGGGEGFAAPNLIDRVAGRLQRLGLTLDYWAMDEPLWFGHERTWGQNDCAFPVEVVAGRAAGSIAKMRKYFPNVVIGDVEVLNGRRVPEQQLLADYVAYAQDIQRLTGRPLAFMHWDVSWRGGGGRLVAPFSRQMHALGLRVGVIIGGDVPDPDDMTWVSNGLQHVRDLASEPAAEPDDFVVQSWQNLPTRMLPETSPGTATFELLQSEQIAR